ncbi:MAG: hypothetical protein IKC42_03210, partial [Alistipes sp.]|nr:hypothetical protein [Alistipes sp.]
MKKLFYVAIIAIATMIYQDATAQNQKPSKEEVKAHSEQLMQLRLQMLKEELSLSDEQMTAFEPVYRDYRKAVHRVVDNKGVRVKKEDMTNDNALKVVSTRLSNTINTTSVKQKYLLIFAEVIEPLKIAKLYNIEDRIAREARTG